MESSSAEPDLTVAISQQWDKMVVNQKAASSFINESNRKNLSGSTLFAFFNKKLVSDRVN